MLMAGLAGRVTLVHAHDRAGVASEQHWRAGVSWTQISKDVVETEVVVRKGWIAQCAEGSILRGPTESTCQRAVAVARMVENALGSQCWGLVEDDGPRY